MMASSHVPFATICWVGYATYTNQPVTLPQLMVAGFAGLLPDIDSPSSTVGQRIRPIAKLIGSILGHRGFTHSLICAYLLFMALVYVMENYDTHSATFIATYLPPILVGYLSHLLGDMFTPSGVPLFWPIRKKISLPLTFKANSRAETIFVSWLSIFVFTGYVYYVFPDHHPFDTISITNHDSVIQYVSALWHGPAALPTVDPALAPAAGNPVTGSPATVK